MVRIWYIARLRALLKPSGRYYTREGPNRFLGFLLGLTKELHSCGFGRTYNGCNFGFSRETELSSIAGRFRAAGFRDGWAKDVHGIPGAQ